MIKTFQYESREYRLLGEPAETDLDEPGFGAVFTAKAEPVDRPGERYRVYWESKQLYDVSMQKVEMIRRSIDLCEYVEEAEIYRQAGAEMFYGTIEEICDWSSPKKLQKI